MVLLYLFWQYRAYFSVRYCLKMSIALKEAAETEYWLELLHETDFLDETQFQSIYTDNQVIRNY